MQRFGFEEYGKPSVFKSIDAPVPEPKAGQVQLRVLGFGLNPYDASLRRGEQAAFRKLSSPWYRERMWLAVLPSWVKVSRILPWAMLF